MTKGWSKESRRHALAAKGIETSKRSQFSSSLNARPVTETGIEKSECAVCGKEIMIIPSGKPQRCESCYMKNLQPKYPLDEEAQHTRQLVIEQLKNMGLSEEEVKNSMSHIDTFVADATITGKISEAEERSRAAWERWRLAAHGRSINNLHLPEEDAYFATKEEEQRLKALKVKIQADMQKLKIQEGRKL